ncbi:MAG: hypothetical protein J2P37_23760, partial [Ktedonobacteraceae bacterium]|nr:hypothetical protein [Ktedonobacteraceae bacterium]
MNEPPVNRNRLQGYVQDISARARDAWARVRQPGTGGRILSWSREQLRELVAGVRFLTVIPVPGSAWLSSSSGNVVDSRPVTGS